MRKNDLSRWDFIVAETIQFVGCGSITFAVSRIGPSYLPGLISGSQMWLLGVIQLPVLAFAAAYSQICTSHSWLSALSVTTKTSEPQDWPHLFGAWSDAYKVCRFWG
jgi:hypothetical protein